MSCGIEMAHGVECQNFSGSNETRVEVLLWRAKCDFCKLSENSKLLLKCVVEYKMRHVER